MLTLRAVKFTTQAGSGLALALVAESSTVSKPTIVLSAAAVGLVVPTSADMLTCKQQPGTGCEASGVGRLSRNLATVSDHPDLCLAAQPSSTSSACLLRFVELNGNKRKRYTLDRT